MTTQPFDQFNKRLFHELLSPFGQVTLSFAVPGEERAVDVLFVPILTLSDSEAHQLLGKGRALREQREEEIDFATVDVEAQRKGGADAESAPVRRSCITAATVSKRRM